MHLMEEKSSKVVTNLDTCWRLLRDRRWRELQHRARKIRRIDQPHQSVKITLQVKNRFTFCLQKAIDTN